MTKLTSKTILVTGGAVRIGRAISLAAAREGADLIIHHNQSSAAAESLREEAASLGRQVVLLKADFSSPDNTRSFAKDLFESYQVDAVINNASIFDDLSWNQTTIPAWNRHMHINLTAPFILSQAYAKSLAANQSGRIINMLDWRALRPGADHLPYTISKAGLAALTKSLAVSLAPAITVNGIALGAILPPSDGGEVEDLVSDLPMPRWAEIQEVEKIALFLLSSPRYLTGEIIHLDGGRHLL